MQKITPFLWFDNQAEEAVNFYVSIFANSKIENVARYGEAGAKASGRPEGSVMTASFMLEGQEFVALNGGPAFTFSPAISFYVACENEEEVDEKWKKLSEGGSVLMELGEYPFSRKYGWLMDRYGVSWQINLDKRDQKIIPCLLFVGEQYNKATEAMQHYVSLFENSEVIQIEKYTKEENEEEGAVKFATFRLHGQDFIAMDSGLAHQFTFTLATSFVINCDTQEEVDHFWDSLSEGGRQDQCGWLQDRYGVAWQVVPRILDELMTKSNGEQAQRVMQAMLGMKKLDIAGLHRAYEGR